MIVKRGERDNYWSSIGSYNVGLSTGFTPKGKVRPPVVTLSYTTFKKMTGIALKPGEVRKLKVVEIFS